MRQVLFRIPPWSNEGLPIYGYGMMLFLAFVICNWVAGKRAQQEGIAKERIHDLAIWLFVAGLVGARTAYLYNEHLGSVWEFLRQFPRIWDGGIILYGSVIGGLIGYGLAYVFILRKYHLSTWKLADIIAPAAALGLGLGRVGCLLNGCCFGNVAPPGLPALHFPLSAPPRYTLVEGGLQTAAGFVMTQKESEDPRTVTAVAPGSPGAQSGLQAGDVIVKADDRKIASRMDDLEDYLVRKWPRGKTDLALIVERSGHEVQLPPFKPKTLGLHPTQVYESISMGLLFFLLTAYYPFRRHEGEVMILLMICYGAHRYLNERLRNDPRPEGFEQYISILLIGAGLLLALWLWRKPAIQKDEAKS